MTSLKAALVLVMILAPGCKQTTASKVKVIGGVADTSSFPATVGLRVTSSTVTDGSWSTCTGTFVRDDLLVTASHCLLGKDKVEVITDGGNVDSSYPASTQFALNPTYTLKQDGAAPTAVQLSSDISFVYYPSGTATQGSADFAATPPAVNDAVSVAGFGRVQTGSANTANFRYSGTNVVAEINNSLGDAIVLKRSPSDTSTSGAAITAEGDSGGPLYNAQGQIVGIVSLGNANSGPTDVLTSIYVNVTNADSKAYITSIMSGTTPAVAATPAASLK